LSGSKKSATDVGPRKTFMLLGVPMISNNVKGEEDDRRVLSPNQDVYVSCSPPRVETSHCDPAYTQHIPRNPGPNGADR
jgi:hypothetical protein